MDGYSHSQIKENVDYNYLVYLPKDYSEQTKNYPLIIYLHGGSHKGNDLNKLKEYRLPYLVKLIASLYLVSAFIVIPIITVVSVELFQTE